MSGQSLLPVFRDDYGYLRRPLTPEKNRVILRLGRHWPSQVEYMDVEYDGETMDIVSPSDPFASPRYIGPCRVRERVYY